MNLNERYLLLKLFSGRSPEPTISNRWKHLARVYRMRDMWLKQIRIIWRQCRPIRKWLGVIKLWFPLFLPIRILAELKGLFKVAYPGKVLFGMPLVTVACVKGLREPICWEKHTILKTFSNKIVSPLSSDLSVYRTLKFDFFWKLEIGIVITRDVGF